MHNFFDLPLYNPLGMAIICVNLFFEAALNIAPLSCFVTQSSLIPVESFVVGTMGKCKNLSNKVNDINYKVVINGGFPWDWGYH